MNTIINKIDKARRPSSRAAAFGRVALVATALCAAMAPSPSFAEAKSATLSATGYSGTETITGFPALVKLSATDDAYGFSYSDCVNGKDDLWFEDADGNLIPHDVDTWNASGDSYVWVRIPSLTNGTKIVMHWGATRTAEQTCTPAGTWAGYVGVWHMNETGTTAEPDSTANGLDAAPVDNSSAAGATTSIATASGKVGSGRASVSKKRLKVTGHTLSNASKFAVSGWFKTSSYTASDYPRLFSSNPNTTTRTYWELYRQNASTMYVCGGAADQKTIGGTMSLANNTWHYLTLVYDNTTATLYDNGVKKESSATITAARQNTYFTIGGLYHASANRSFIGTLDEVRMYDGVASANRVAADYATMNAPTTFLTLVSDDTPVTATWTGAAGNGDATNAANWNCLNEAGVKVDNALPTAATAVTVSGDNLNIQIPAGTSFECRSFTLGSTTLARDCDLTGVDVVVASDATIDLKGYALFVKGLSGGGTITSTADANAAYTTLDFIQSNNNNASQYIITDYTPRYSDTFVTRVNFQNTYAQCIYCARGTGVSSGSYTCVIYGGNLRFDHVATTGSLVSAPPANVDCTFAVNGKTGVCKMNGISINTMATSGNDTATAASALSFFVLNNSASGVPVDNNYKKANFKMYFFRIYDVHGALVRDYVPAKNGNGVAGLWDRANNAFWPSAGASQFIAGNETARGEVVFCGTGTWSGVTIAPAVTVVKDLGGTLTRSGNLGAGTSTGGTGAFVFNDGTATFAGINAGDAEFNVYGGNVTVSSSTVVWGGDANKEAVWNQYGGSLTVTSSFEVGPDGEGEFVQTGGNVTLQNWFNLGRRANGNGTYTITGGKLLVNKASNSGADKVYLACARNSKGTLNVGGNGEVELKCHLSVGAQLDSDGGKGYVNVYGNGKLLTTGDNLIGQTAGETGEFKVTGGTLDAQNDLKVAVSGEGTFNQSGGTVKVGAYLQVGIEAGSTGTYTMTGGTLKVPNQPVSVGRYGTGTLVVSGTAVVTASKGVRVGFSNGSAGAGTGTLVVTNGGTVATSSIYGGGTNDAAQATVLFDGATVQTTEAGEILKDLASVMIGAGGLTITNAYAASATNTTFKVAPGMTAITMTGEGTLDLSQATVELASAPRRKFVLATATGSGSFTGVPSVVRADGGTETRRFRARLANGGKDIEILSRGFMILVR